MKPKKDRQARKVLKNVSSSFIRRFLFFGRNSGIHGLKQIFAGNTFIVSRLFWVTIFLISSGCLYMLVVPVVELGDQVNYTPETRYLPWVTTFPAVTVCENTNVKTVEKIILELYHNRSLNYATARYIAELLYGKGSCNSGCIECGPKHPDMPCFVPWRDVIEKIHKQCTEMITDCRIDGQEFDCCEKFRLVDSEYGYCFSFNTLQNKNSRYEPLYTVNRSTGPGVLTFRLIAPAKISVHSPEELSTNFLDVDFKFDVGLSRKFNRKEYLFSMVEMQNDPELLSEEIEVRGCRKLEEIPEGPFHTYPVYSYGACRLAEDTEHMFEHCGCVWPVRDLSYKMLYCNNSGLNCLVNLKAAELKLGRSHEDDDDCLPSCFESELTTIHVSEWTVPEYPYMGPLVIIRMSALPTLRYIRNLIRTDLDLVVSVGGIVSLFFAASILSIVEIFYLIIRPQK